MANLDFDATDVAPSAPLTPIPPDEYQAMIVESEMKPTKKADGHYLAITWQIIDGDYAGRKVFGNLNLDNPNATAVDIARRDLSAICHACGKLKVSDSTELHDIPCIIHITVKPGDGQYAPRNEIKGYTPLSGTAAPAKQATSPARQVTQPAAKPATSTGKPPWARKTA